MTRLRALGYAILVAVVVFYYLATPTLREVYGPRVVLPAYVAVGLLAGAITYGVARHLSRLNARLAERDASERRALGGPFDVEGDAETPSAEGDADAGTDSTDGDAAAGGAAGGGDDPEIEQMLGELEADREE